MSDGGRLLNLGEWGSEEEDHSQWDATEEGVRRGVNLGQTITMGASGGKRPCGQCKLPNTQNNN